ncbi:MAG: alginate lyase family protein [Rhodospirillales bacterium]|nr:alginate lyase family protein [Rhodospirillales bacterium]MBO6787694.1 alginate lyase family protein [Rhodospirillales bacterium]
MNVRNLKRKFAQLAADPVLRSWLLRRAVHLHPAPPPFVPHLPAYAWERLPLAVNNPVWADAPAEIPSSRLEESVVLDLAGADIPLDPAKPDAFFDHPVTDIEVDLARHRFAWLPVNQDITARSFRAVWQAWRRRYFDSDGMHWHPYTAAERAINIIDAAPRLGLPADAETAAHDLAKHATVISERLEYFGDHDTSNHLANNGRGLYRIGCTLADATVRGLGFDILANEAARIFLAGGMLREGSSHYHFLYLRNYLDVWLSAARSGFDEEAAAFAGIAERLMAAARHLVLPGGLPLIGDISPDCPPAFLAGLERGAGAWAAGRDEEDREKLTRFAADAGEVSADDLVKDGWLRADYGRWSALVYAPPQGWPFMPGHAHQDLGSAEIHVDGKPLFIDPGRGAYGETGAAAAYRSSAVHGTLRLDGADPYPANKPYYDNAFRERHAGPAAVMPHPDGFTIAHGGYRRLGADDVRRRWCFEKNGFRIEDGISGNGRHDAERALVTPMDVRVEGNDAIVGDRFSVSGGTPPQLDPVTVWHAYGRGTPGTRIRFDAAVELPWSGTITVTERN